MVSLQILLAKTVLLALSVQESQALKVVRLASVAKQNTHTLRKKRWKKLSRKVGDGFLEEKTDKERR